MKKHLKRYTSITHYIDFLKRQSRHAQHVYGVIFAGTITACIAVFILYEDYGFWQTTYKNANVSNIEINANNSQPESPKEMVLRFASEAKEQFTKLNISSKNVFNGRETYTNETK